MAYVTNYPNSMAEYPLYHTPFHPTEPLKNSILVSSTELPPQDDLSTTPRTIHYSSVLGQFNINPEQNNNLTTDILPNYHPLSPQHQDQTHHQQQEQLTLLTSLNKQTIALLQTQGHPGLSPLTTSENEQDVGTPSLEQALVMGQIALVLASSVYGDGAWVGAASVSRAWSKLQEQEEEEEEKEEEEEGEEEKGGFSKVWAGTQVVLALTIMGMALVKHFDGTGDGKDLEEAGVVYERGVGIGMGVGMGEDIGLVSVGMEQMDGIGKRNVEREIRRAKRRVWKLDGCRNEGLDKGEFEDEDGDEEGYGRDMALMLLDRLRALLTERGFAV